MQPRNNFGPAVRTGGSSKWQTEFGLPLRFPRLPVNEIKQCMQQIVEPEIFLRDIKDEVEIVIRLRKSANVVPRFMKKSLRRA